MGRPSWPPDAQALMPITHIANAIISLTLIFLTGHLSSGSAGQQDVRMSGINPHSLLGGAVGAGPSDQVRCLIQVAGECS